MSDKNIEEQLVKYISNTESLRKELLDMLNIMESDTLKDDTQKRQAAYALNMCTVSVSQIVDYQDINILEQEYDAILNNINLENMPKDDALLKILRQLLDTITYFRIAEGDKNIVEREYEQKVKNALWSAVPNFGLIVAGGNPLTMAVSLASQVGIGYMNYRRNKADYELEHEKELWQLQRTAIEQFNGLRRELFDTAWRLADTYNFPDEYRLTERQIKQYNNILVDQDEIRKYERLESIQDNFHAYPPFWYFIGNAANYIAHDKNLHIKDSTRSEYKERALHYFEEYEKVNELDILREDQLAASCMLEHADLLLEKGGNDEDIEDLLDKAVHISGNLNDVLEICSITYLRIGKQEKAEKLLKILVNEDYNRTINAQLLSCIYVNQRNRADYDLLATRIDPNYLYPMPENDDVDLKLINKAFGEKQRDVLKRKYSIVFHSIVEQYAVEWNKVTSRFNPEILYSADFFFDTSAAKKNRISAAREVFSDPTLRGEYQNRMKNSEYELNLLNILNDMWRCIFDNGFIQDIDLQNKVINDIKDKVQSKKDDIITVQKSMDDKAFSFKGYVVSQNITITSLSEKAVGYLTKYVNNKIDKMNGNDVALADGELKNYCSEHGIPEPEISIIDDTRTQNISEDNLDFFSPEIFGREAVLAKKNANFLSEMTAFTKKNFGKENITGKDTILIYRGDPEFDGYFYGNAFNEHSDIKRRAVLIIHDESGKRGDLIFTTEGIVNIIRDTVKYLTPYEEVEVRNNSILLYSSFPRVLTNKTEYKNPSINMRNLYALIKSLAGKFINRLDEKVEYIEGTITPQTLNKWFRENPDAMSDSVVKIYAIPKKKVLDSLGIAFADNIDPDHNLIQAYYDRKTKDVLGLRIVAFDKIDSNFQAILVENQDVLKVK